MQLVQKILFTKGQQNKFMPTTYGFEVLPGILKLVISPSIKKIMQTYRIYPFNIYIHSF